MAHLNGVFLLLLFFFSPWLSDGKIYFTDLGTKCIDDCIAYGGEYKCTTINEYNQYQTMYCSPQKHMDYWDRECSNECGMNGQQYYWCRINMFQWGYCGVVIDDDHHGSYYESLCYDRCDRGISGYYWCHTVQGWDYCSPYENTDYKNKQCVSPCAKQGEKYNWCWLTDGSKSYCGPVEPKMLVHRTKYNDFCMDECQYNEKGDYYWCHTANSWDYCSPDVDITYRNQPCRSDHSCGLNGQTYNWCWTESSYDYCGPIQPGECTYSTPTHCDRRRLEDEDPVLTEKDNELICSRVDKGNKKITTISSQSAPYDITDGSEWRSEAENLISRWDNGYLVDQQRSNLLHSRNLRIDMQPLFNRNNQRYYNLQIQINTSRRPGQSTTVSQVLVPAGVPVPDRYIRYAFIESFNRRARLFIDVSSRN